MTRPAVRDPAAWAATRQLVLDRYGPTLGRAVLARVEQPDDAERPGNRSPRSGSVVLVLDKRTGYATFRGRVLWRGTRYEVYVGVPRDARSLKPHADRCRRELNAKIKELEGGSAAPRNKEKTTLREWATAWLTMKQQQGTRATTLYAYEGFMRLHVLPAIGHVRLADLAPETLWGLYETTGKSLADTTVKSMAICLRTCLRDAALARYPLPLEVVSKLTQPPAVAKSEKFVAPPEMLRRLLDATRGDREHALWHVAIWTGGRLSEPLGLWWDDVDLETGEVTIRQRLSGLSRKDDPDLGATKTNRTRVVYLPAEARAALRAHRERQEADAERLGWPASRYVFRSSKGQHLIHVMARYYWHRALLKAGLPDFPIKQLRHSLATNLGVAGVPLEDVKDVLGHAVITTTDGFYRQRVPAKTVTAIEALAALLGPPG